MENIGQLLPLSIHTTCGLWFCSSARGSAVGYMPTHHIPDTVCLARVQLNGAAPRSRPTLSLQMALFSDTLFIVSAVGGDGNHCCGRCWVFLGFVFFFLLYSTTLGGGRDLWAFSPSLRSCPHLLGGKAWISPFPLSLPLKRSLSPSHLAPLLISSPPGKPLCTSIKKGHLPCGLTCSVCPPARVL